MKYKNPIPEVDKKQRFDSLEDEVIVLSKNQKEARFVNLKKRTSTQMMKILTKDEWQQYIDDISFFSSIILKSIEEREVVAKKKFHILQDEVIVLSKNQKEARFVNLKKRTSTQMMKILTEDEWEDYIEVICPDMFKNDSKV